VAIVRAGELFCVDDPHFVKAISRGVFEGNNLLAAMAHCGRGIAIDGGAHVGSWTVYMAKHFKMVYSFEPKPENFECLRMNTEKYPNVMVYNKALGDKPGKAGFHEGTNSGSGYLEDGDSVEVVTVDSLNLTGLDFLKLDVEGYEPQAINGAMETIGKYHPVILVEQKEVTARYGKGWKEAGNILTGIGYKLVDTVNNDFIYKYA